MTYLRLLAAGHALLIESTQVERVVGAVDAAADTDGDALDLSARLGGPAGQVVVVCQHGLALAVDAGVQFVDVAEEAWLPAPWLPESAAALVDAVSEFGWRLRAGVL